MTRTRRVAGSVAISMASQVAAMVVGLWLTRFVLERLGQHDYGVWLVILQALGYLALADLGVVALLPRQTAFVTGRDAAPGALPRLVGEAARLVLWQWPLVIAACAAAWLLVPLAGTNREVLGLALAIFALAFPLRRYGAVLQGLQDLVFLGWLQFAVWLASAAVTVVGLLAGLGMHALVLSWGTIQLVPPLVSRWRLGTRHPHALPRSLPPLPLAAARAYMASALWVSLGQLSSVLVHGADVLIIGALLGPAAVVPYVITLKLIGVIGNFPLIVAHASGPALSQMRAGESRHDLRRATGALSQAVLAASGAVACVVLAANEAFVGWWVGAAQYAGTWVTVLGAGLMLLRHYGTTVIYAIYSFGHERRLALAGIAEGALAVGASLLLVGRLGVAGAVISGLVAAVIATLPLTLPTLAAETGTTVAGVLRSLLPFAARVMLALAAATAIGLYLQPATLPGIAGVALLAAAVYAAVIVPVALRPPLREYVLQLWQAVRARLGAPAPTEPPPPPPAAAHAA